MGEDHFLNLQPGTIVNGRYEVVKCLGTGSMGMVYACRHRELAGHLVAMKVLFSEVARDTVAAQRFRNEIVASYGVSHPHVVRAYEYFRDGDLIAFTMEYIGGGDLADRISSDDAIPPVDIVRMLRQMCSGVQAIHDAGIIHRDLKPENILITSDGDIKITDFGIARTGTGPKLTEHGGVVGTIDYVSPEYLERGQVDERSDIYALGVLAYEMLTGEAPFKGKSVIETMTMRLRSDPPPPSAKRSDCPPEIDRVVAKAMARDPEQRYQSASEMGADLEALGDVQALSVAHAETKVAPIVTAEVAAEIAAVAGARESAQTSASFAEGGGIAGMLASEPYSESSDPDDIEGTTALSPQLVEEIVKETRTVTDSSSGVEKLESVLRHVQNGRSSDRSLYGDRPAPSVTVGHGKISMDRMRELTRAIPADERRMGSWLYWLVVVMVGFGLGVLGLRHYKPELFGESRQTVPSYFEDR